MNVMIDTVHNPIRRQIKRGGGWGRRGGQSRV